MKHIVALLAVVAVAFAAPADVEPFEDAALEANFTRSAERLVGFAGFGGGTQGGRGGPAWTVWDPFALRDALNSNARRVVYVRGRIDLTPLFTASPGVRLNVGRYTSIIGGDRNAMIFGGGLRVGNGQVIIQNIRFHNALNYAPGETPNGNGGIVSMVPGDFSDIDSVEVTNSEFVWIDHCEFADDPWNHRTDPARRHDGLIDIVRGSNWITVSNNIFRNHNLVTLVGNGDNVWTDNGRLKVTFFANWYRGTNQRNPRVRFGEVHILNNLYTDITDFAIGVGVSARIVAARNVFINTRRVLSVAFNNNNPGYILMDTNRFTNAPIGASISSNGVNWRPWDYYQYRAIPIGDVENHVRRFAGVWQ